jgi:Ca-activated chloride channel family protein
MNGEKLECMKRAACLLIENLSREDYLSVVVFNDKVKTVIPKSKLDDKNAFFSRVSEIKANGGTRMYIGMEAGMEEIGDTSDSSVNRMILFTDGQTEREVQCLGKARLAAERGISIATFGIGDDYNEELLGEVSRITLGGAYHLQHHHQIQEQFMAGLKSATNIGITNANLTFQLSKDVVLEEVHRITPNIAKLDLGFIDERMFSTEIGGLDKDEITCFGAKLLLPVRSTGPMKVGQVTLKYDVPSNQITDKTEKSEILVEYTKDRDLCGRIDKEVMSYFDQLSAQGLIEQATRAARDGNVAVATQKLNQARVLTQRIGNVLVTQQLHQAIEELNKKGTLSAGAQKTIRLGSTHTVRITDLKM